MRFFTETDASIRDFHLDIVVCALGYEARATKVARTYFSDATRRVCIGFDRHKTLNYSQNLEYFRRHKYEIMLDVADEVFESRLVGILSPSLGMFSQGPTKIGVDISCFDRHRLAILTNLLFDLVVEGSISEVLFFYNVALYQAPSSDFSYNTKLQPVHAAFVGARPHPGAPTVAVIGLGYEREKAVGAAEYLEASEVYAFIPKSGIERYFESVQKSNALLLAQLRTDYKVVYDVSDAASLVSDLSSLVRGLMYRSAVLLVPLGPKMFALAALLTAKVHTRASVWRMSQAGDGACLDRLPTDSFSILKMKA